VDSDGRSSTEDDTSGNGVPGGVPGVVFLCFPAGVGSWLLGAVGLGRYRWGKACEYSFGVVVYACQSDLNKKV